MLHMTLSKVQLDLWDDREHVVVVFRREKGAQEAYAYLGEMRQEEEPRTVRAFDRHVAIAELAFNGKLQ